MASRVFDLAGDGKDLRQIDLARVLAEVRVERVTDLLPVLQDRFLEPLQLLFALPRRGPCHRVLMEQLELENTLDLSLARVDPWNDGSRSV